MKSNGIFLIGAVFCLISGVAGGLLPIFMAKAEIIEAARAKMEKPELVKQPEKPWDFWTIEIESLAAELSDELQKINERAALLDARESRIEAEAQQLDRAREDLESLRKKLDRELVQLQEGESKNLRSLAQTYSALEPKAAVAILSEMDDGTVVKILSLMKADALAAILGEMGAAGRAEPEVVKRAARLSEKLRLLRVEAGNT